MQNFLKRFKNTYIPKLRFKEFNDSYFDVFLKDVLFYEQPTKYVVKTDKYDDSYETPVLTANKSFILGKTNEQIGVYSKGPVILFDDFTTDNKYVDFKFKIKSSAIKLLTTNDKNNLFYLYNLINVNKLFQYGHNRHWIQFTSNENRWICTLKEQEKISKFIWFLDQQISLLENKLQLMEQKIKYFLKILLTKKQQNYKIRFKNFNNDLEIKKIYEITTFIKSGGTPKSKNSLYYTNDQGINFLAIPDMKNKYLSKTAKHITKLALENSSTFIFEKNNLLYSIYATIGEICINKIDVALPQSILGIKVNHLVVKEYLYYLLVSNKEKIIKLSQTGSQPNLSLKIFKNIKLLITTDKNEQIKISKFLGTLDYQKFLIKRKIKKIKKRKLFYLKKMFI